MNELNLLKKKKFVEAPPTVEEAKNHLNIEEQLVNKKIDKRSLRKTGRTQPFSTRMTKEWLKEFKSTAKKEKVSFSEFLEILLNNWKREKENKKQ